MERNSKDNIAGCITMILGFICFILAGSFGVELMSTVNAQIDGANLPNFVTLVVVMAATIAITLVSSFLCWFAAIKMFRHEL